MAVRSTTPVETTADQFVTTPALCRIASCSRWTLRRWAREKIIPPPIRINHSCVRWPLAEVLAALRRRQDPAASNDEEPALR